MLVNTGPLDSVFHAMGLTCPDAPIMDIGDNATSDRGLTVMAHMASSRP